VDGTYKLLLVLHLVSVVVGIGGVMLNGVYGLQAKARPGPGGLAITEANHVASNIAEYFVYAVPVFGVLMVLKASAWDFSQTWVWLSILLYVVALGIVHGVMVPNVKKMIGLQKELVSMGPPSGAPAGGPPPQVAELERRGKTLATFGPMLNIIAVALIALMVTKPGL
jgi:uncharacterized membrane protein